MSSRSLGHRAPLLWLVLPMMAGLGAAGYLPGLRAVGCLVAAAMAATGALVAAWRGWPKTWAASLSLTMALAGMGRYYLEPGRLSDWDALPPRETRLVLRIDRLFATTDPAKTAGLAVVVRSPAPLTEIVGQRVAFSLRTRRGLPAPVRGAEIAAIGVLGVLPLNPAPASFEAYLAGAGVHFRYQRGRALAEVTPASAYRRFCARTLGQWSALLGEGVRAKRPALVAVFRAMLLGQQGELSPAQATAFRQSGTMHVFSISGLHIGVIALGLTAILGLMRIPRWPALLVNLGALWLYVDITGTAPSAVRAFVMVALVQAALNLRLPRNALSALTASALVVLLITPLDFFSASFQMSYGIVAALLLLGLPLGDHWQARAELFRDLPRATWTRAQRVADALWRPLLSAAAIGVSASLVSAVTGAAFFQMLTPGAFFSNLWVIPVSSLVILIGLVSLLGGLIGLHEVAVHANHAAILVLSAVDRGLQLNLRIPGMWFGAAFRFPEAGSAALIVLLAVLLAGYADRWSGWSRGFWPPFAVVAIALALGATYPGAAP